MRRVVVAAMICLACAGQAAAGDLPPPAAPVPPSSYNPVLSPYKNWSGVYVGVNGGYDFGSSNWNTTGNFNTDGGLVGGTLGVNFPLGPLIFGFEGDIDWADVRGSNSVAQCTAAGSTTGAACETKINTLGTARARLGYGLDRILVFVSAGGAFSYSLTGLSPPGTFDGAFNLGWAASAGAEFAVIDNWTLKAEYLYVNFGSGNCATVGNCGGAAGDAVKLTESIVRGGVNYKFSW